jgi:hypothetical protein
MSGGALVHSRNVPKVLEAARQRERSPSAFLIAVGEEARKRGTLNSMSYSDELYDSVTAAPARNVSPSDAMIAIASDDIMERWTGGPARAIEELAHRSRQRHLPSVVHVSRAAEQLSPRPVPWQSAAMGVTIPRGDAAVWEVAADRRPDYVLVDDSDPEPPITGAIATWRFSFAAVFKRAVEDLALALHNLGVTTIGFLPEDDAKLAAGDVAVVTNGATRARIHALQQRGVRVVQPAWAAAVAHAAESLIDLHRQLSTITELGSAVNACGPDQASWDPAHVTLLDADDPADAARRAGTAYLWSILRGTGRL